MYMYKNAQKNLVYNFNMHKKYTSIIVYSPCVEFMQTQSIGSNPCIYAQIRVFYAQSSMVIKITPSCHSSDMSRIQYEISVPFYVIKWKIKIR